MQNNKQFNKLTLLTVNFDQIMMLQLLRGNYYILKKNYFRIIFDINI